MGVHDLSKKIDLIVLVHNLSHKIPTCHQQNATHTHPALSLILNEAKVLGIPWVLAITNKFSVSAHQQKSAVNAILQAYQASPRTTEVINSCPYVTPSSGGDPGSWDSVEGNDYSKGRMAAQNLLRAPINLVRMPFQKKSVVLPVEGVNALCQLIHRELCSQEEASLQVHVWCIQSCLFRIDQFICSWILIFIIQHKYWLYGKMDHRVLCCLRVYYCASYFKIKSPLFWWSIVWCTPPLWCPSMFCFVLFNVNS